MLCAPSRWCHAGDTDHCFMSMFAGSSPAVKTVPLTTAFSHLHLVHRLHPESSVLLLLFFFFFSPPASWYLSLSSPQLLPPHRKVPQKQHFSLNIELLNYESSPFLASISTSRNPVPPLRSLTNGGPVCVQILRFSSSVCLGPQMTVNLSQNVHLLAPNMSSFLIEPHSTGVRV